MLKNKIKTKTKKNALNFKLPHPVYNDESKSEIIIRV